MRMRLNAMLQVVGIKVITRRLAVNLLLALPRAKRDVQHLACPLVVLRYPTRTFGACFSAQLSSRQPLRCSRSAALAPRSRTSGTDEHKTLVDTARLWSVLVAVGCILTSVVVLPPRGGSKEHSGALECESDSGANCQERQCHQGHEAPTHRADRHPA